MIRPETQRFFLNLTAGTTLFLSRPTLLSVTDTSEKLVHFLSLSPDLTKSVAYLEPYTDRDYLLDPEYSFLTLFNWQESDGAWKGMTPVVSDKTTYEVINLSYASIVADVVIVLRSTL